MTTLVIGGAGFIGQHLAGVMRRAGERIISYDKSVRESNDTPDFHQVMGDVADIQSVERVIQSHKVRRVVHLVSTTLPTSSNIDPVHDVESNVLSAIRLIEVCVRHEVEKLVFMSSGGTVYGNPLRLPVDELHPTNPLCSYGIHKLAIEKYIGLAYSLHGLKYAIIRAANPIGPGQRPSVHQGVVANFLHRMHAKQPLIVWGDGSTVRDYFDVRDLAAFTLRALKSDAVGVFNAGSGIPTSISKIIKILADKSKIEPEILFQPIRNGDVSEIYLDINRAESSFKWKPEINLEQSIEDYIIWYGKEYLI